MSTENTSDVQAAIAAMEKYYEPQDHILPTGDHVLIVPKGMEVKSLKPFVDEYRTAPERVRGTAQLESIESFVDYVKAFAGLESKLFATIGDPETDDDDERGVSLTAIIDHHGKGPEVKPSFCTHRALYTFPMSEEWIAWIGTHDKWLTQADFAAFLEDHAHDVLGAEAVPDASGIKQIAADLDMKLAASAQLIQLSRGLSVRVDKRAAQTVNLQTGEAQLLFSETHNDDDGKPLQVPGGFAIAIPVFDSGQLHPLFVRLRYRMSGPKVAWSFSLHRAQRVLQHAFRAACEKAREATSLPLFYGRPEI